MSPLDPWLMIGERNLPRLFMASYNIALILQLVRSYPAMLAKHRQVSRQPSSTDSRASGATSSARSPAQSPSRLLGLVDIPTLSPAAYRIAFAAMLAGLASAVAGMHIRSSLALAILAYPFVFGPVRGLAFIARKTHSIPWILIALCGADGIDADYHAPVPHYPLATVALVIGLIYFASFLEKMRHSGLAWADGRPLQSYLLAHALWGDMDRALWVARRPTLCRVAAMATLAFEGLFPVVAFIPESRWVFVPAGLAFHLATLVTMRVDYLRFLGPAYLVFFAPPLFQLADELGWLH